MASDLPTGTKQLLTVISPDWDSPSGELRRFDKSSDGSWSQVGAPIPVSLGKAGLGWGRGIFPKDLPDQESPKLATPVKREGDNKSPAGIFNLGDTLYGYSLTDKELFPQWTYIQSSEHLHCIEDLNSPDYNRILVSEALTAKGVDSMKRTDNLYELVITVSHNVENPKPGSGSCIFLHIWRGPGMGTAGCTAMNREELYSLAKWLDPLKNPIIVQLPKAEYDRLQPGWDLP